MCKIVQVFVPSKHSQISLVFRGKAGANFGLDYKRFLLPNTSLLVLIVNQTKNSYCMKRLLVNFNQVYY
jgi:hypothetical protein